MQRFEGHTDAVYCVAMSAEAGLVATGAGDDTAVVWSTVDGSVRHKLTGHTDSVSDVAFNKGGTLVATASYDSTVKVGTAYSTRPATGLCP